MVVCADDLRVFVKPEANTPPRISAVITPDHLTNLPQTLSYKVSAEDSDGAARLVSWDFGDGVRSTASSGSRIVGVPGSYRATVRVADDDDAITSQTLDWVASESDYPKVEISAPKDGETVTNMVLLLNGTAAPDNVSLSITSDRNETGGVQASNQWNGGIYISPGWNRVMVQAKAASGKIATAEVRVRFVPPIPLAVPEVAETATSVERWNLFEANFAIKGSAATHLQFPYETNLPPSLEWIDGITVDGVFTPDNWKTVYRRPAFLNQRFQRALRGNVEWLRPLLGAPAWTVRFSPPVDGNWKYRIEVHEAKGSAQSPERSFTAFAPTNSMNHGAVRASGRDSRYFEFEDGSLFLGNGHGMGASDELYSFDVQKQFAAQGDGTEELLRFWIAGHLWGSAWQPWASRTLGYNGTVPATGLSVESAYADGLASLRLDANNSIVFQGFMSGHPAIIPGHTYHVRVRWRTEDVQGPANADLAYGVCVRLTGWPEVGKTHQSPLAISHVVGTTPWHVAETNIEASGEMTQNRDFLANVAVIMENTTGGRVYVDEVSVREVFPRGRFGAELLRSPRFNSHLTYDLRRGAGLEAILADAASHGKYLKLVISEKQEDLMNWISACGLPDPMGGHFFERRGPGHRLHEYYWRHLIARFGAYRSVHSWETVNEEDPNDVNAVGLTADLAAMAGADGNPKMVSTSTWTTLATNTWKNPALSNISFTDFHCYVRGTGWIEPKNDLANDSARFFHEYDMAGRAAGFGKPVVWGEQGIDGGRNTDNQEPLLAKDTNGVWLHKMVWARTGPGGVYPLYWYTENIYKYGLHSIYGRWNRFMNDIPLNNGHYADAQAVCSSPNARAWGQKDLQAHQAHLWIDNAGYTWRAVVEGREVPPVSTTVKIAMDAPSQSFQVKWYNTATGLHASSEMVSADAAGQVVLSITNLVSDIAAKIVPLSDKP